MDNTFQAQYTALKILRQRCEYLQQRLESLEEENCQLKLQKITVDISGKKTSDNNILEEQIITLNKENCKMSRQIQLITIENQNLWSQLSKLISGSDNLGTMLSVSAMSSSNKNEKFNDERKEIVSKSEENVSDDCSKESLEEISLKLINGILMGKTELESQYSQMIDLQKENSISETKNYPSMPSQFDSNRALNIMRISIQNLKDFKETLSQQKIDLKKAIDCVKNLPTDFAQKNMDTGSNNKMESLYNYNERDLLQDIENSDGGNNLENDKICPMCGKHFTGNFSNFFQHVNIHFEDGNEEFISENYNFMS